MGVGWVKKKTKKKQLFAAGGCNASRAVGSERLEILHSLPFQVDTGAPSHKSTEDRLINPLGSAGHEPRGFHGNTPSPTRLALR